MYSNVHMTTPFNLLCILTISFTPHEPKLIQTSTENYTYKLGLSWAKLSSSWD